MTRFLINLLFLPFIFITILQNPNPVITFRTSGEIVQYLSLSEIKSSNKAVRVQIYDPHYKKNKEYRAFLLHDLLKSVYGNQLDSSVYTQISFKAIDGYEAVTTLEKVKEAGGYVVFEDIENSEWEALDDKGTLPAPYYIIWKNANQTVENGFPWPWQLESINIMKFEDQYPKVFPAGASKESTVFAGFEIFKNRCINCHSMNQQGGKVGIDLNEPKSIVSYRSPYMIKEMIKHPSKYRYTKMPDNEDLTDFDLSNLLDYFNYMNPQKN